MIFTRYLQFISDDVPLHVNVYNYNFIFSSFIEVYLKNKNQIYLMHTILCF